MVAWGALGTMSHLGVLAHGSLQAQELVLLRPKGVFIPWQKPWDGKARVSKKGSGFELRRGNEKNKSPAIFLLLQKNPIRDNCQWRSLKPQKGI